MPYRILDSIGKMPEYSKSNAKNLIDVFMSLETFIDVASWDTRAKEELDCANRAIEQARIQIEQIEQILAKEQREYQEKELLGRFFSVRKIRTEALWMKKARQKFIHKTSKIAGQLEALIAISPDDPEKQNELRIKLYQRKQELQKEKEELDAALRQLTANAQPETAQFEPPIIASGKLGRNDRLSIQLEKDAKHRPHENAKAAIERQIIAVEKMINLVERIHK